VLAAQIEDFDLAENGEARLTGGLKTHRDLPMTIAEQHDDRSRIQVSVSPRPTLLFLSRQWHPQWIASTPTERLECPLINGFYQGVIVPPNTREVVLEFRPLCAGVGFRSSASWWPVSYARSPSRRADGRGPTPPTPDGARVHARFLCST